MDPPMVSIDTKGDAGRGSLIWVMRNILVATRNQVPVLKDLVIARCMMELLELTFRALWKILMTSVKVGIMVKIGEMQGKGVWMFKAKIEIQMLRVWDLRRHIDRNQEFDHLVDIWSWSTEGVASESMDCEFLPISVQAWRLGSLYPLFS